MTAPTRELVIAWARKAGVAITSEIIGEQIMSREAELYYSPVVGELEVESCGLSDLERLCEIAYAAGQTAEREACLAECEAVKRYARINPNNYGYFEGLETGIMDCERRIRNRIETKLK